MTSSLAYEMITINGALKEAYDCIVSYNSQRILSYMNETSPYYVNYNQLLILFCHLIQTPWWGDLSWKKGLLRRGGELVALRVGRFGL